MLNINLLPGEDLVKKGSWGKFFSWVLTYGRYIVVGTEIIVLLAFFSRFKLDRDLTDLHKAAGQKEAIVLTSAGFENQVRSLQNHLKMISGLLKQKQAPRNLLTALSNLTPRDVVLSELAFSQKKMELTAISLSNDSFNIFLNNLSASPLVTNINLDAIDKNPKGPGIEFHLSAGLKL